MQTLYDTQQEAKTAAGPNAQITPVYLLNANTFIDVRHELHLRRRLENLGLSTDIATQAVGVVLGWVRQRAQSPKWYVDAPKP